MSYRKKIFSYKNIYDLEGTDEMFLMSMRESIAFHRKHCQDYDKILRHFDFDELKMKDISEIPPLTTMFLKRHGLYSMSMDKMVIKSETSGTSGMPTTVGLDRKTCYYGAKMLKKTLSHNGYFSAMPSNYIVLGYEPSAHNKMGAVKTAYVATFLAPPINRTYALVDTGLGYELNLSGIEESLEKFSKSSFPTRFIGFPSYFYMLLKSLKDKGIKLKLHEKSMVFLSGGWKEHLGAEVEKRELYSLTREVLGISEDRIREAFAVVESNVLYCDCINHHFHVPIYGRVIIRDPETMKPLPYGEPGLLNLISPLVGSMPLGSIITDDIAVLRPGSECGCGIETPYFEILGRAGMTEIVTCTAIVNEYI